LLVAARLLKRGLGREEINADSTRPSEKNKRKIRRGGIVRVGVRKKNDQRRSRVGNIRLVRAKMARRKKKGQEQDEKKYKKKE